MRIAVVSKSDARGGGASRVAEDLAAGLRDLGHVAAHFMAHRGGRGPDGSRIALYGPLEAPICFGQKVFRKLGLPDVVPLEWASPVLADMARDYDVIHFHDLTTAMSPIAVKWLAARRPCFWTFHDCSPFTGGCFYPQDCARFVARCGSNGGCPQIGRFPTNGKIDLTGFIQSTKTALHKSGKVIAITPSRWMADLALSSGKLPKYPAILANGVDTAMFAPIPDRSAVRRELGLPENRPIILISAGDLRDPRKGFRHSLGALHAVADLDPFALIVGNADPSLSEALKGVSFQTTGYIDDAKSLSRWYGVADVFLFCSLADNQPLAILETMACGVPLVGFATGGIPEMIEQGQSGMLVAQNDQLALFAALRTALAPGVAGTWGSTARRIAVERFSRDRFLARHLSLYQEYCGTFPFIGGA